MTPDQAAELIEHVYWIKWMLVQMAWVVTGWTLWAIWKYRPRAN